jgi:hypothetical protein
LNHRLILFLVYQAEQEDSDGEQRSREQVKAGFGWFQAESESYVCRPVQVTVGRSCMTENSFRTIAQDD